MLPPVPSFSKPSWCHLNSFLLTAPRTQATCRCLSNDKRLPKVFMPTRSVISGKLQSLFYAGGYSPRKAREQRKGRTVLSIAAFCPGRGFQIRLCVRALGMVGGRCCHHCMLEKRTSGTSLVVTLSELKIEFPQFRCFEFVIPSIAVV